MRWWWWWWWWWWDESVYLFVDARKLMNVLVQDEIQTFASFGNLESWVEIYPWIYMKRWWMSPPKYHWVMTKMLTISMQWMYIEDSCSLHPPLTNLNQLFTFIRDSQNLFWGECKGQLKVETFHSLNLTIFWKYDNFVDTQYILFGFGIISVKYLGFLYGFLWMGILLRRHLWKS